MNNLLFQPLQFGAYTLPNRIFMSPLTRSCAQQPTEQVGEACILKKSGGSKLFSFCPLPSAFKSEALVP